MARASSQRPNRISARIDHRRIEVHRRPVSQRHVVRRHGLAKQRREERRNRAVEERRRRAQRDQRVHVRPAVLARLPGVHVELPAGPDLDRQRHHEHPHQQRLHADQAVDLVQHRPRNRQHHQHARDAGRHPLAHQQPLLLLRCRVFVPVRLRRALLDLDSRDLSRLAQLPSVHRAFREAHAHPVRLRVYVRLGHALDGQHRRLQRLGVERLAQHVQHHRFPQRVVPCRLDRAHQRVHRCDIALVGHGRLLCRQVYRRCVDARHLLQRSLHPRHAGCAGHAAYADGERLRLWFLRSLCCHANPVTFPPARTGRSARRSPRPRAPA